VRAKAGGSSGLSCILGVVLGLTILAPSTRADELYVSGGVLEGKVLEESGSVIRLQTASGVLAVPASIVARRVPGPSRMEKYAQQLAAEPLTARRHLELAEWCRDVRLSPLAEKHLQIALDGNPRLPAALEMAGYVQLGEVWLKAGPAQTTLPPARGESAQTLLKTLIAGWTRRVSTVYEADLRQSADPRSLEKGRRKLLAIGSPLAIPALCKVLGDGDESARSLLAEFLASYKEDDATIHLLALSLMDPSERVRRDVASALARRGDPRVGLFLRGALLCEVEQVVNAAAEVLGWMGDRSAAADLVEALPTDGFAGPRVGVRQVFGQLATAFNQASMIPIGAVPIARTPTIALVGFKRRVEALAALTGQDVGPFRSEVQDALIALTGQNFGFDVAAWRDWIARNPAIDAVYP
jgi:hypothetical protein